MIALVLCVAVAVLMAAMWVVAVVLDRTVVPAAAATGTIGPPASIPAAGILHPMFVCATPDGIVLDGLLDLTASPVGIPTTWRLRGPLAGDPDTRHDVLTVLQSWADEDAAVDVDFRELCTSTPSIAFSRGDEHFRLAVTVPPKTSSRRR